MVKFVTCECNKYDRIKKNWKKKGKAEEEVGKEEEEEEKEQKQAQ